MLSSAARQALIRLAQAGFLRLRDEPDGILADCAPELIVHRLAVEIGGDSPSKALLITRLGREEARRQTDAGPAAGSGEEGKDPNWPFRVRVR